jgi:altronate dehydratase small subunit
MEERLAIQIRAGDNVVTLVDEAAAGDRVQYATAEGRRHVTALDHVPFGHKLAVVDVPEGEPIVKYDEPIGRASQAIRRGEHVHTHNVESAVQGGATCQ